MLCFFSFGPSSQFMDDNDDEESQKFLTNGMMKKKKYEEYHEEYVRIFKSQCWRCDWMTKSSTISSCSHQTKSTQRDTDSVEAFFFLFSNRKYFKIQCSCRSERHDAFFVLTSRLLGWQFAWGVSVMLFKQIWSCNYKCGHEHSVRVQVRRRWTGKLRENGVWTSNVKLWQCSSCFHGRLRCGFP